MSSKKIPKLLEESKKLKKIETTLFKKSDIIFTLSEVEKRLIEEDVPGKRVELIPIFVYEKFPKPITNFSQRTGVLFVGGFQHTPNLDGIQWFTKQVFPQIIKQIPDIKLHIVGSNPPSEVRKIKSKNISVKGLVSDKELEKLYQQVRLVIVPLRYGAGVKGKVIEAMYHGLPIVSTSTGLEGIEGIEGAIIAANDAKNFSGAICELYEDEKELSDTSQEILKFKLIQDYSQKKQVSKDLRAIIASE